MTDHEKPGDIPSADEGYDAATSVPSTEPIPADVRDPNPTSDSDDETVITPTAVNPLEVGSTIKIDQPCKKPLPNNFADYGMRLSVLYTNLNGLEQYLDRNPHVDDSLSEDFVNAISMASSNVHVYNDGLMGAALQKDRTWGQNVEHDGIRLGAARPRIAKQKEGDNTLVGDRAIRMIASKLSDSQTIQIPLWSSGIWLCIEAPDLIEQDRLDRRIANERVRLGRNTRGAIFSNDSVYFSDIILDFALERVFDCNVKGWTPEILRKLIRQPDIQTIAWALALSMNAKGFPLSQPCTTDPNQCTYVTNELIDLGKIHWVDRSKLNDKQRKFMLARDTKRTEDQITDYQSEFKEPENKTLNLPDFDVTVVYSIPSADDHVKSGMQWIEDIVLTAERTFGERLDDEKKEEFFLSQANASRIRRYSHWISSIIINGEDGQQYVISDRDTIEKTAVKLCTDVEARKQIINGAVRYANSSLISMVALPNYACPSCGTWHHTEEGAEKMLFPLDAVSVFFTLLQFSLLIKANT